MSKIEFDTVYMFTVHRVKRTVDRRYKSGYRDETEVHRHSYILQPGWTQAFNIYHTYLNGKEARIFQTAGNAVVNVVDSVDRPL